MIYSRRAILQLRSFPPILLFALWALGICFVAEAIYSDWINAKHLAATRSAVMVVVLMAVGWLFMLLDFRGERVARVIWTLGVAALLIHILLAFWLAHGWSHEAAVEHVREVGGFGAGIIANYLFALLWLTDVAWWWIAPVSRAHRPRWIGWVVHGYLAFIVLNATVVFGPPERQFEYAGMFACLGILACRQWIKSRKTR